MTAAKTEANSILNFEATIMSVELNASIVIKILMVKPIPPRNETPNMCVQFKSSEIDAIFVLTAKYDNPKIPMDFPNTKPKIIPSELRDATLVSKFSGKVNAVFARANMGRTIKATG